MNNNEVMVFFSNIFYFYGSFSFLTVNNTDAEVFFSIYFLDFRDYVMYVTLSWFACNRGTILSLCKQLDLRSLAIASRARQFLT